MNRKILTFVVITLGLIYLALAANFLYQYREVASVLRSYGISDAEINSFESTVVLRRFFLNAFIVCSFLGAVTLFLGTGVFLAKRWAERAWLVVTILLSVLHLIRLVAIIPLGAFWLAERTIELALVVALAIFSWKVLHRPRGKQTLPSISAT
jgi:cytochrome c biogenesis protein CcdA